MNQFYQRKGLNTQEVRIHNCKVILELLYREKVLSKSQLSVRTGLSIVAISNIIKELLNKKLIEPIQSPQKRRGNADQLYTIVNKTDHILCLNVMPNKLTGLVVNNHIIISSEIKSIDIHPFTKEDLIKQIINFYMSFKQQYPTSKLNLAMAIHGQVDVNTGTSLNMPQAPWKDAIEFKYLLSSYLKIDVILDNDCVMLALAEKWLNYHQNNDFCVLHLDYGVGSSFVINNNIYRGQQFGSGQIGHTIVISDGKKCSCGRYGCLETISSSKAILTEIRTLIKHAACGYEQYDFDKLSFENCIELYHSNDERATNVIEKSARVLGISLYNFLLTLNINQIILYGNVTKLGDKWLDVILEQFYFNPFENSLALKKERTLITIGQLSEEQILSSIAYLFVEQELASSLL